MNGYFLQNQNLLNIRPQIYFTYTSLCIILSLCLQPSLVCICYNICYIVVHVFYFHTNIIFMGAVSPRLCEQQYCPATVTCLIILKENACYIIFASYFILLIFYLANIIVYCYCM